MEIITLLSGGMDSTTALALACKKSDPSLIHALSFNYGQRHRLRELMASQAIAKHYGVSHDIIDLSTLGILLKGSALTDDIEVPDGHYEAESMRVTVVPNRNAIMLSIAFAVARAEHATQVWAGMHAGDHYIYPDCRSAFMNAFERAMALANDDWAPIDLEAPFLAMSKADIAKLGDSLKVPFYLTYSCYKGKEQHCGTCGTCTERREAFELANVTDPTSYLQVTRTEEQPVSGT